MTTQTDNGEQFSVVVSNSLGTAPSTATLTIVQAPSPATYYVDFASGSDRNSGISKDAPWQYAPGMNHCAFNCALIGLQPGDQVIFKGGVTWDASAFPMVVSASGASGNPIVLRSGSDMVRWQYVEPARSSIWPMERGRPLPFRRITQIL